MINVQPQKASFNKTLKKGNAFKGGSARLTGRK